MKHLALIFLVVAVALGAQVNLADQPIWTTKFDAAYSPDGSKPSFTSIFFDTFFITIVQDTNTVFRVDLATGDIVWSWTPPNNVCVPQGCRLQTNIQYSQLREVFAVIAVPAQQQNPSTSYLAVLNLDGEIQWTKSIHGGSYQVPYYFTLAADDQLLMFTEIAPAMASLNITNGDLIWQVNNNTIYKTCWARTSGIEFDSTNNLIIADCGLNTIAFDLEGHVIWTMYNPTNQNYYLVPGMFLYWNNNSICAVPTTEPTSDPSWCYYCGTAYCGYGAYSENSILLVSQDMENTKYITGFISVTENGQVQWKVPNFSSELWVPYASIAESGNYVFTVPNSGENVIAELSCENGKTVSSTPVGHGYAIYVNNDTVIVSTGYNSLAAYNKK